jgi:renalase
MKPLPAAGPVAVIGAGMAGATCARRLAAAGLTVEVFDKSRGVGGRLATRRAEWADTDGRPQTAHFDHGTPAFSVRSPRLLQELEQARRDGLVARWAPVVEPRGHVALDTAELWLPVPDMPTLCRAWLAGLPLHTGCPIDGLQRGPAGWSLVSAGDTVASGFAAVVLALPLPQALPLARPHAPALGARIETLAMVPTWTLMAVTDEVPTPWDIAWPTSGALATVLRNDHKPGRVPQPGLAHWVAHATTAWSETHLERPPAEVLAMLQQALAPWLQGSPRWHHAVVHRWRYASARRAEVPALSAPPCAWDAALALGLCGDALGGAGVEGAWLSGEALAAAVLGARH